MMATGVRMGPNRGPKLNIKTVKVLSTHTSAPILSFPDFNISFILYTDASGFSISKRFKRTRNSLQGKSTQTGNETDLIENV